MYRIMKKISLLSIPLLLAASCSVWAQMSGSQTAANQNPQSMQQQKQRQNAQYQQNAEAAQTAQTAQAAQPVQYVQPVQSQYALPPQQQTVSVSGEAAVPVTTVVPVQQQPASVVTYSTVVEPPANHMSRQQRRSYKAALFAAKTDSLVRSRNFVFYPNSMQEVPEGSISYIVADYFYFGMSTDTAEVHLPAVNGSLEYLEVMNFDAPVTEYRIYPFQHGLSTTFWLRNNDDKYFVRFVVSEITGETVLLITTPTTTMRYAGWLSLKKLHED